MKKIKLTVVFLAIVLLLVPSFAFSDNKQKIGEQGDKAWNDLIAKYKGDKKYADLTSSTEIVKNFKNYDGKLVVFPNFTFNDFVTDRNTNKYYYFGEKNSLNYFVIKYNDDINKKLYRLADVFGGNKGVYEVLGIVKDAYTWWGNVVLMEIKAIRQPGGFCIVIDNDNAKLVAEDLIQAEINQKAKDSDKDLPKGLKAIPKGLAPLTVAKLFYYIGSVEKNKEVWQQLLNKSEYFYAGKLTNSALNYWEYLTNKKRVYVYVRDASGYENNKTEKKYIFQIIQDGVTLNGTTPITVTLVDGEWKVLSANP